MDDKKVNILGAMWTVSIRSSEDDPMLETKDGYCDNTVRLIVVSEKEKTCDLKNFSNYQMGVMRHEIIHAYLFESGLGGNFQHPQLGHDETYVDWIARQFKKILATFQEIGCI